MSSLPVRRRPRARGGARARGGLRRRGRGRAHAGARAAGGERAEAFEAAFAPDPAPERARAALVGGGDASLVALLRARGVRVAGLGGGAALPIEPGALELSLPGSVGDAAMRRAARGVAARAAASASFWSRRWAASRRRLAFRIPPRWRAPSLRRCPGSPSRTWASRTGPAASGAPPPGRSRRGSGPRPPSSSARSRPTASSRSSSRSSSARPRVRRRSWSATRRPTAVSTDCSSGGTRSSTTRCARRWSSRRRASRGPVAPRRAWSRRSTWSRRCSRSWACRPSPHSTAAA